MLNNVTHVTVLVEETDEALEWYTATLGFEKRADDEWGPGVRWVTVAPADSTTELVLQEPRPDVHGEEQAEQMRSQIGSAPMTVISTDDCRGAIAELEDRGVTIRTPPEDVPWGTHAVIEDLYGNPYNLVESHE